MIEIGLIHWIFLILFILIIFLIFIKRDTTFSYLAAIFALGLFATGSVIKSVQGVYASLLYAFQDLSSIILAIAFVTALGKLLEKTGILEFCLKPITKVIKNKYIGFWVIGLVTLVLGLFFNPSPAVVLIAIIFLPVAKKQKCQLCGLLYHLTYLLMVLHLQEIMYYNLLLL